MILVATNRVYPADRPFPQKQSCNRAVWFLWGGRIIVILLLLGLPLSGFAQGAAATQERSLLEQFAQAARQGDAVAQTNLGAMYLHGVGVRRNLNKAFFWFQRAADQEEGLAQFNLGVLCQEGQGIPKDEKKAVYWFRRVASQSARVDQFNPVIKGWAQLKLGFSYYEGRGVPKDYQEALHWFRLAAERGIAMAQEMLGQMYARGQGGPQNEGRAFFWYEQAAGQGSQTAEKVLQEFSKRLSLAQQAEARTLESPPRAAAEEHPPSGLPAQLVTMASQQEAPLKVLPNPADAQVRILNIRPVYTPGMRLKPGKYQIEVTRTGYKPETLWVEVQNSAVQVDVTLTPEGSTATATTQQPTPPPQAAKPVVASADQSIQPPVKPTVAANTLASVIPGTKTTSDPVVPRVQQPASQAPVAVLPDKPAVPADKKSAAPPALPVKVNPVAISPDKPVSADKTVSTPHKPTVAPQIDAVPRRDKRPPRSAPPSVVVEPAEQKETRHEKGVATRDQKRDKQPVMPAKRGMPYALTVQTDPVGAQVKVMNIARPYQPGILLNPGVHRLEVTHPGFETQRLNVAIQDQDKQVTVALVKSHRPADHPPSQRSVSRVVKSEEEACPIATQPDLSRPRQYRLTVQSDPQDAHVQILNIKAPYQPGMPLSPGRYHLSIAKETFKPKQCWAEVVNQDLDLAVALRPVEPGDLHALTIQPHPADAQVRLLNIRAPYRPGIRLESGSYTVEVSKKGYQTVKQVVELGNTDRTLPIHLTELPMDIRPTLTVVPVLDGVKIRIVNADTDYRPGLPLAPGNYLLELSKPGFKTVQRWVALSEQDLKIEVVLEERGDQKEEP